MDWNNSLSLINLENDIETRSISPENPTGEKGKGGMADIPEEEKETHPARELGRGWKVRPFIRLHKGETITLCDITGEGIIRHIWMVNGHSISREIILRMYYEGATLPAVEVPVGDFFFNAWNKNTLINSSMVTVNPAKGYNSWWAIPFKKKVKITLENRSWDDMDVYYQIDYQLRKLPEKIGYFHATFHRVNPLPYKEDYVILDTIYGQGHYVGTFVAYGAHNNNWWGEGEVKFFIDDDHEYPTICTTGQEDYFLGSYNFENWETKEYQYHSTLYSGFYKIKNDNLYAGQVRFGMYRIHQQDPIYFKKNLKVTMQCLGWMSEHRFHVQQDDIASVSYYYLNSPEGNPSILPSKEECEII